MNNSEPQTAGAGKDEAARLFDALNGLMALIENETLVRNTDGDGEPGWAIRQLPLVQTLAFAKSALDEWSSLARREATDDGGRVLAEGQQCESSKTEEEIAFDWANKWLQERGLPLNDEYGIEKLILDALRAARAQREPAGGRQ